MEIKDDSELLRSKIKRFEVFDRSDTDGLIAGDTRRIGSRSTDLDPHVITHFDRGLIETLQKEAENMPVSLEIGFGKGRSLLEYAKNKPERLIIGIEVKRGLCNRVMRRVLKQEIGNLKVVLGDCRRILPILFPRPGIDEVFLLFPDPWWKKRHAKRRYGVTFFRMLSDRLKPGGLLVIKSDIQDYLEFLVNAVNKSQAFEPDMVPANMSWTNREYRLRTNNLPIFEAAFQRKKSVETMEIS